MDVLIIEDDDDDAREIEAALGRGNTRFRAVRVGRLGDGLDLLARRAFDAVLLDLAAADAGGGGDAFARVHAYLREVPVVIVTAVDDADVAALAVRAGVQDYVVKEGLATYPLGRTLAYAVERFQAARALRQSQERYRLLFESLPTPCFLFDERSLAILAVNEAAERLYGWSRRDLLRMTLRDIRPPEELPRLLQAQREWRQGEAALHPNRRHRTRDGREVHVDVLTRPFRVAGGAAARIALVTDVTERHRAEAMDRERAALRDTVAAMDQVLGVVGHELRTPLAGLRAISELMLSNDAGGSADTGNLLRMLHGEVVRMSDTVDALLEAARLNSGRATWNWSRFPVGRVCLEAIAGLRSLVDPRQVLLQVDVDPATEMCGDAEAVRRLLTNLLSNACKHTAQGFLRISVHEEAGGDGAGAGVSLRVADSGCGIPPGVLGRLGEAFALNSGVVGASHVGGTGLGLAICKGIVAAHGGRLTVESEVGRGTVVTAWLRSDLVGPVAAGPKSFVARGLTACAAEKAEA